MKKLLTITAIFLLFTTFLLFAEDAKPGPYREYEMGSQMFTFRAGPIIPTFFSFPLENNSFALFPKEMHMKVGGFGSIRYQGFLNSTLALGGELGYIFAYDIGDDLFTSVPIEAKLTYIPIQGKFELPLSIGLGGAYNSYSSEDKPSFMSLLASAEIGFSWFFKKDWGITLSGGLQVIPELYGKNHPYHEHLAIAAFMPITLSLTYRSN